MEDMFIPSLPVTVNRYCLSSYKMYVFGERFPTLRVRGHDMALKVRCADQHGAMLSFDCKDLLPWR